MKALNKTIPMLIIVIGIMNIINVANAQLRGFIHNNSLTTATQELGGTDGNLSIAKFDPTLCIWDYTNVKVGIGTGSPSNTLDVRGGFRYVDGNQQLNYILTTDANGNARWAPATGVIPGYDADWHETPGVAPDDINDDIYTHGNVGIGLTAPTARLHIYDIQDNQRTRLLVESRYNAAQPGTPIRNIGGHFIGNLDGNAGNNDDIILLVENLLDLPLGQTPSHEASIFQVIGGNIPPGGPEHPYIGFDVHPTGVVASGRKANTGDFSPDLDLDWLGYRSRIAMAVHVPNDIATAYAQNSHTGLFVNNLATETSAQRKYGIRVQSTGAWSTGSGASYNYGARIYADGADNNIGLHSEVPVGTGNFSGIFLGGNVGIGLSNPTHMLEVIGDIAVDGTAYKTGQAKWTSWSDERLKKDVKDFVDGLDIIQQIRPITYKYNGKAGIKNTDKEFVGVIAQELQKVAPYMVSEKEVTDEDGVIETYLAVNPSALDYIFINAVKEQQDIIETQGAEIETLTGANQVQSDLLTQYLGALQAQRGMITELQQKLETQEQMDEAIQSDMDLLNQTLARLVNCCNNAAPDLQIIPSNSGTSLQQNIPNPFTRSTEITYSIENAGDVDLTVYSADGMLITNLFRGYQEAGTYTEQWQTVELPTGVYIYILMFEGTEIVREAIHIKE